jgi:ribosome biogenesis GTPase
MLRNWSIILDNLDSTDQPLYPAAPPHHNPDLHVPLESIGWDDTRVAGFASYAASGLDPGRVARVDGRSVLVITADGTTRAEGSTELFDAAETAESLPATGDWIGFSKRPGHDTDLVEVVLPRRSVLTRTRQVLKNAVERQVVAANVDAVFIVHAAINLNLRRLEREAAQVAASGAQAVILLNKSDLVDDVDRVVGEMLISVPDLTVHAVSGVTGDGVDRLLRYVQPDRTVVFLGASGVGKSTLINRLLGSDVMDTGAVREDDQRGRHTTTARHLLPLDGGGALIDTPGVRALGLSDAAVGVEAVFDDIAELALSCRFSDCLHVAEPGCAVQEAVRGAELDEGRLNSYRKLEKEAEFIASRTDMQLRNSRREIWKSRAKRNRQAQRVRQRDDRN